MGNSYSTRGMTGSQKSQLILDIQASHDEALRKRSEYLAQKEKENNSPKGILLTHIRHITQKATAKRVEANEILMEGAKQLRKDIVELVKNTLSGENGEKLEMSSEEFFNTVKFFSMPLDNLKTICDMIDWGVHKYTEYDNVFYDLMNIDIRFALIASKNSLKRSDIKFGLMPDDCKQGALKHFEELELTKNKRFMDYYAKYVTRFKDSVKEAGV